MRLQHTLWFRLVVGASLFISLMNAQGQQAGGGGASTGAGAGAGAGTGAGAGGVGKPGGGGTGTGLPGRGTQNPFPTDPRQTQQQQPSLDSMTRPIFLSGKVMLDDGTPPPEPVVIERVCNGQPRPEGYTNSKGHFSFQLGQNQHMMADASVSNAGGDIFGEGAGRGGIGGGRSGGVNERQLMGCEIRASL